MKPSAPAWLRRSRSLIVTFGMRPDGPNTGYGYIRAGAVISGDAHKVARFAEKPDLATAQEYVASGDYLWNSGMFVARADVLLGEL